MLDRTFIISSARVVSIITTLALLCSVAVYGQTQSSPVAEAIRRFTSDSLELPFSVASTVVESDRSGKQRSTKTYRSEFQIVARHSQGSDDDRSSNATANLRGPSAYLFRHEGKNVAGVVIALYIVLHHALPDLERSPLESHDGNVEVGIPLPGKCEAFQVIGNKVAVVGVCGDVRLEVNPAEKIPVEVRYHASGLPVGEEKHKLEAFEATETFALRTVARETKPFVVLDKVTARFQFSDHILEITSTYVPAAK